MAKQKDVYGMLLKKGFSRESINKLLHSLIINDMSFKDALRQVNTGDKKLRKP